jgi:hypothetical protein
VRGLDALAQAMLSYGEDKSYSDIVDDERLGFPEDDREKIENNIRFLHFALASAAKRVGQSNHRITNMSALSRLFLSNYAPPPSSALGVRKAKSDKALVALREVLAAAPAATIKPARPARPAPFEEPRRQLRGQTRVPSSVTGGPE